MEYLKTLVTNRISIVIVLIHWILVLPDIWDYITRTYFNVGHPLFYNPSFWDSLPVLILVMDLPAILITVLIWSPYYFIGMPEVFGNGAIATSFFTITIQWLIIGKLFSSVIDRRKQKVIDISLFDGN